MFDINKTKAVLWDLDDTLYSRRDAAKQSFYGMFRENLYCNRDEEFICETVEFMMTQVKRNSMIHEDAFAALLEKYPPDREYIRANCLDYYYEHISDFAVPFPEQIDVIRELKKRGVKNAIVTNVPDDRIASQHKKIEALGIGELFDAVVISAEVGIHKPDRRIFDHVASLLGVSNFECVFVGDDPVSDVEGALGADMEVVWLDEWDYDGRFGDEPRLHRVKKISEYFAF